MAQLFETREIVKAAGYAAVAIEQGIDLSPTGLTYGVPESLADLRVGERVVVPLGRGNKKVPGYVVGLSGQSEVDPAKLKFIDSRDPGRLSLTQDLVDLAAWIASYYCCPLGMVFATMLPSAVKKRTGLVTRTMVRFAKEPEHKATKLQKAVVEQAKQAAAGPEPWTEIRDLADLAGARSVAPVKALIEAGVLEVERAETVQSNLDLRAAKVGEPPRDLELNEGQQAALTHLTTHLDRGFSVHLLHGVTGSGKTEVYLRLIQALFDGEGSERRDEGAGAKEGAGPSAIVLVPEIALTPQTVARFVARFPSVAVLHSGLTASQRFAQWRRIRSGEARIVVGARSAIFAPLPNPRLIIVDEEHEASYKQDQLPRYHARDVAVRRAQLLGVPVVLGSATPSLESYWNARPRDPEPDGPRRGRYHLLRLPERAPGMKLPDVEIVDLIAERRSRRGVHLLSQRLEQEIRLALEEPASPASPPGVSGGRVMLLLNRRGYANYIACPDHRCGWMQSCEFCDATMVYHRDATLPTGGLVRCHHCEAEQILPQTCPTCGKRTSVFGLGVQRVEEELQAKFPGLKLLRMDSDTMRSGGDYQASLDAFRRGDVDLLLGTQMIAKGLDFPSVRLVGVISGDTSLHMPDFRASERTFQLIAQVAGRAGRSEKRGKVIVQSFNPEDPAIQLAAAHDYDGFAARELGIRAECGLPPVGRMARVVIRDPDFVACTERARELADHLNAYNEQLQTGVRIRGPMPCPVARVADHHRQQVELIAAPPPADHAARLQKLLTSLRNSKLLISDHQTAVDVDPVSLL